MRHILVNAFLIVLLLSENSSNCNLFTCAGRIAVCMTGSPRHAPESTIPYPTSQDIINLNLAHKAKNYQLAKIKGWPDAAAIFSQLSTDLQTQFQSYIDRKKPTVVDTLHDFMYPALGKFDVFMLVNEYALSSHSPEDADVDVRVNKACKPYVPKVSSNHMYCKSTPDYIPTPTDYGWPAPGNGGDLNEHGVSFLDVKKLFSDFKSSYAQMWDAKACDDMIIEYERKHSMEYDLIVRVRPDMIYFAPLNVSTAWNQIKTSAAAAATNFMTEKRRKATITLTNAYGIVQKSWQKRLLGTLKPNIDIPAGVPVVPIQENQADLDIKAGQDETKSKPEGQVQTEIDEEAKLAREKCQIFIRSFGQGGEDIFNVGRGKVMHGFLRRFVDIKRLFGIKLPAKRLWWSSEDYASLWMNNVCKTNFTEVGLNEWPMHPWRFKHAPTHAPYYSDSMEMQTDVRITDEVKYGKNVIFFICLIVLVICTWKRFLCARNCCATVYQTVPSNCINNQKMSREEFVQLVQCQN